MDQKLLLFNKIMKIFTSFGFSPMQGKFEHRTFKEKNGTFQAKSTLLGFGAESTIIGTIIYVKKTVRIELFIIFISLQTF